MINNSEDQYFHIGRAAQMAGEFYDLDVTVEKAREVGGRIIKNAKPFKVRRYLMRCEVKDFKVKLPCEAAEIEGIYIAGEIDQVYRSTRDQTVLHAYFDINEPAMEKIIGDPLNPDAVQYLKSFDFVNKTDESFLVELPCDLEFLGTLRQFYLSYTMDKNILSFNQTGLKVDVVYKTIPTDEFGFPYISEAGIMAVVHYLILLEQTKQLYKKTGTVAAVQFAQQDYDRSIAQARVPLNLNSNQADSIMREIVSKNRHHYGAPFRGS